MTSEVIISLNSLSKISIETILAKAQELMGEPGWKHDSISYYDPKFEQWMFLSDINDLRNERINQVKVVRNPPALLDQPWFLPVELGLHTSVGWVSVSKERLPSLSVSLGLPKLSKWVSNSNIWLLSVSTNEHKAISQYLGIKDYELEHVLAIQDNGSAQVFFEQNRNENPENVRIKVYLDPYQNGFETVNDALKMSKPDQSGIHTLTLEAVMELRPSVRVPIMILKLRPNRE